MASTQVTSVDRREIIRMLGSYSYHSLLVIREELQNVMADNHHYNALSEVGRTSSSEMLANPVVYLDCVTEVLYRAGKLTPEEKTMYLATRPKNVVEMRLRPS